MSTHDPVTLESLQLLIAQQGAEIARLNTCLPKNREDMKPNPKANACGAKAAAVYSSEWVCEELRILRKAISNAMRCGQACIDIVTKPWTFPAAGQEADIPVLNGLLYVGIPCVVVKGNNGEYGVFTIVETSVNCLTLKPTANGQYINGTEVNETCGVICPLPYCPPEIPEATPPPVITAVPDSCIKVTPTENGYTIGLDHACVCAECGDVACETCIQGVAWRDGTNDGDPNNENLAVFGIPNVSVTATGPTTATLTTDSNGGYNFQNLPVGTYTVAVDQATLPSGFVPTTPLEYTVTIDCGDCLDGSNFGVQTEITPIEIESLCQQTNGIGNAVRADWVTGAEINLLGFRLCCRPTGGGPDADLGFTLATGNGSAYSVPVSPVCVGQLVLKSINNNNDIEAEFLFEQECP